MREQAAVALEQLNQQLSSEVELRTAERDRGARLQLQQAPSFMYPEWTGSHLELVNDLTSNWSETVNC